MIFVFELLLFASLSFALRALFASRYLASL